MVPIDFIQELLSKSMLAKTMFEHTPLLSETVKNWWYHLHKMTASPLPEGSFFQKEEILVNKKTIIRTFEKIALYMELLGENHFKVSAFRKAANVLELDPRSLSEMDDILTLKGIGKGTGAVITDLMEKGESDLLKELEESSKRIDSFIENSGTRW